MILKKGWKYFLKICTVNLIWDNYVNNKKNINEKIKQQEQIKCFIKKNVINDKAKILFYKGMQRKHLYAKKILK